MAFALTWRLFLAHAAVLLLSLLLPYNMALIIGLVFMLLVFADTAIDDPLRARGTTERKRFAAHCLGLYALLMLFMVGLSLRIDDYTHITIAFGLIYLILGFLSHRYNKDNTVYSI